MDLWTVFGSEVIGTAILILLGVGVVANVSSPRSSGNADGNRGHAWVPIVGPTIGAVRAFWHVSL